MPRFIVATTITLGGLALLPACERVPESMREHGSPSATATIVAEPVRPPPPAPAASAGYVGSLRAQQKIEWIDAPETPDVAAAVRAQLATTKGKGRQLLVYVGATWCEPCQRFHEAVRKGELDASFPTLTILAFDRDRDGEALATADYVSTYIPLFAVPAPNGKATGKQIEGSIKGNGAVGEITPKLQALLAQAPRG